MRKFRRNTENLRDTRIAYTFLLSLAFVCAILGIAATRLGTALQKSRLENCYESLSLCADALEAWHASESAQARYEASVRFESAAAGLPSEVELETVMSLGDYMRMGESAAERVRVYADTFALLSSIDYTSEAEARRIIADTLDGVSSAFEEIPSKPASVVTEQPPEVLAYSKKVAEKSMKALFGNNAVGFELALSEDSGAWTTETENLRLSFSPSDGSLEGFVYIRVGDRPSALATPEQKLSAALELYKSTRHGANGAKINEGASMCGFTLFEIVDGEEYWHSTVDSHGRVWSLTKVKR